MPDGVKLTFYLDLFSLFKNQLFSVRLHPQRDGIQRIGSILQAIRETSAAPLFAKIGDDKNQKIVLFTALDWLYRIYEAEKEKNGYIDFDDQKLLAYELLLGSDDVKRAVQAGLDVVIVDEFQDLNELDFQLILLVSEKAKLIVVGDDDQSIYGFRLTSPKYIIDFDKLSHRYVRPLALSRNYRCPRNIVAHASKLIEHNTYRIKKTPIPTRDDLCDIKIHNALTPSAEAAAIGRYIERARDDGHALSEIAVLYRMNAQSLPLQLELLTRGIPYYCRKEDNIVEQDRLPRVISMLRYAAAVKDGRQPMLDHFLDTVRGYFRYPIADSHLLAEVAAAHGPPYERCLRASRLASTKIGKSNVSGALAELAKVRSPIEAITTIARVFPGTAGLVGSLEEAVAGDVPLGELSDVAVRFRKIDSFADFLDKAIDAAQSVSMSTPEGNAVRLLTYFRSKGTQFDTVILPSINAGIIPHARAPIEDERRLFYVAVTRTKKNLWLSYVKRACNKKVGPSQFLQELGLPDSCWTQPKKQSKA
jgi:DNA helicase-2/ATP-dependent DNA helicase PcrA